MPGAAGRFARLVGQGLSLAVARRPKAPLPLAGFGAFIATWLLATAVFTLQDWLHTPAPRAFDGYALWGHAGVAAAVLAAAWIAAQGLRRPAAWLTLAALAFVAVLPWSALDMLMHARHAEHAPYASLAIAGVQALLALRLAWVAGVGASIVRRLATGVLFAGLLVYPWQVRAQLWPWYSVEAAEAAYAEAAPRKPDPALVPEVLLGRQPKLLADRIAALAPQVPGQVDLYAVGFAGDGTEGVFRNEVEHFARLLAQRFGAEGRVLPLINHPGTVATTPIGSLANLRAAVAGAAARMDRDEDVLLLFLTSHGTREHELVVDLPPLPLRQVEPADLRQALDDAGVQWRVVVVSACYSGGFIDSLRTPRTLVITAARADRTSFGCGADSEITFFGRAFLAEALNQTTDLREAYAIAARRVREWEKADGEIPSQPQVWAGDEIDAHLATWRAGLEPGAPVPFVPAVKVAAPVGPPAE